MLRSLMISSYLITDSKSSIPPHSVPQTIRDPSLLHAIAETVYMFGTYMAFSSSHDSLDGLHEYKRNLSNTRKIVLSTLVLH